MQHAGHNKILKIFTGFLIIIALQFISTLLTKVFSIPLPSSILGLIVFSALLYFKVIPENIIKDTCEILIQNLPMLFIPLTVGIIAHVGLIKQNFGAIVASVTIATIITMILSALFVELIIKRTYKNNAE